MRAMGTPVGKLSSRIRRSTPAHKLWMKRSRGRPCSRPGGGLATTATSISSAG